MASPKQAIKLRLDAEVVEGFRATGPGWQTRINEALRRALKTQSWTTAEERTGLQTKRLKAAAKRAQPAKRRA